MRHARQMSAEDVRRAADRAEAGARQLEVPAEVVRRAADRAESRRWHMPDRRQVVAYGIDMAKPGSERTVIWRRTDTVLDDDCPF
ncbi:hypothetical protein [Methylobacterium aquaticum]|uniref:Uncharacterized protein n=1 Tax=Methylobacterium aquaticum TaxID=270351 RepID=A0A0C6F7R6_9HYPH|nr:hypothetical protein [Methylobacterium aquaticum]BAQ44378.1 hypothetical protein Maq22A_c04870 [Methylobacterium aquaticum]